MPAGGEILLAGETALESEGLNVKLKFHLFDLVEQKHLVGKQYEGPIQNLRTIVHRMVDEVILQLTGERGVNTTKLALRRIFSPEIRKSLSPISMEPIFDRSPGINRSTSLRSGLRMENGLPSLPISNETRTSTSSISTGKIRPGFSLIPASIPPLPGPRTESRSPSCSGWRASRISIFWMPKGTTPGS